MGGENGIILGWVTTEFKWIHNVKARNGIFSANPSCNIAALQYELVSPKGAQEGEEYL